MKEISLHFLSNEADEDEGLGHAGIETFKDAPYAGTARECGQNSADAKIAKPVRIDFDLIQIDLHDFPALGSFSSAIDCCLSKSKSTLDEKGIDFFERAKKLLSDQKIQVLRISDFNTAGLRGPSAPGTPFHSLVKSTGVSRKELDTSGGSFGIGKNAAFAISELQTVFYSTVYHDDAGNNQFLAQGKSLLISHTDKDGNARRQTGYWGGEDFSPIEDVLSVPEWLRRFERGTSIFAVGFREVANWHYRMAASLIRNFFTAIHRGEMEFYLSGGDIQITSKTLGELFENEHILGASKDSNELEEFKYASNLYECLVSEESKDIEFSIDGLGEVRIKLLIKENMPKRLSIIRNGMVITGSLEHFGDKFAQFPMYKEFVALVEPMSDRGSALIKTLENPRHDGVSAERISDQEKRKKAISIMAKLAQAIRQAIKERAQSTLEKVQALDELAEFFADVDENQPVQDPASDDDPERITINPKPTSSHHVKPPGFNGESEGGGNGGGSGTGGERDSDGAGSGSANGGKGGVKSKKSVPLHQTRNVIVSPNGKNTRRVWFTPAESCEMSLYVFASGINSSDRISVHASSHGVISAGAVNLIVNENERVEIDLGFSEKYDGPIEIVGYTLKEEISEN